MPETSLSNQQIQRQEQQLSARQLQSLELLQKPLPALLEELHTQLERNPVLEADISSMEIPSGDPLSTPEPADPEGDGDDHFAESPPGSDAGSENDWDAGSAVPSVPEAATDCFRTISSEKTLEQHLLDELALSGASGKLRQLAEWVISGIDDSGYLRTPPEDLAMASGASMAEIQEALKLVRSFDPAGVGAFTPQECLLLQLDRRPDADPRLKELVRDHLPDVARNQLPRIARAMDLPLQEISRLTEELRKLDPYPGAALSPAHAPFVAPEAEIVRGEDGTYHVVPGERYIRLRIPARYFSMLEDPSLTPADREYIQNKISAAKELIKSLELRDTTIRRIAGMIADEQREFFDSGPEHLKPLTMRRAAEILELHETTVSRAVAGKYVRTPRGIFEFRYFFSTGYQTSGGEAVSSRSVQERLRHIIDDEDPRHPLSDEAIADLLKKDGLHVARRTVAKYRDLLGIPGTSVRRHRDG